jgi:hypothetical protein
MGGCPRLFGGRNKTYLKGVLPMPDPKYGKNDLDHLEMCSRCSDAVPVFIRKVITVDSFHGMQQKEELHCRKGAYYGNKDGTYIKKLMKLVFSNPF